MNIHRSKNIDFDVASNPEFLREGQAVCDFPHPDRIVIGVQNEKAENLLREIYEPIINCNFNCPIHSGNSCSENELVRLIVTDINSAELIKHASNSFLAMKISFINAIADICEMTGANVRDVAHGIGLDKRIGRDFLRAGIGFGGFCLPKDIQSFIKITKRLGYDFKLLREVEKINEQRIVKVIEKLKRKLSTLKGKTIGLLGLSFKPDTDDIRFSPALKIAQFLLKQGAIVKGYDPEAMGKAEKEFTEVLYCKNAYQTAEKTEALIICTEWEEFKNLDWKQIKSIMIYPFIVDGRNMLIKEQMIKVGFEYVGIGI
ncbi:MAG: UDP-glucose 6-dehydrogenase TuaD [candidate division WS2 bacterium]|uniref:UDP-glucose 6-dehydrogenase n=1 Tax=Psychracetigena formicireducens TaxID=2986056 RepID=A0A9E2BI57_PSYF1|nr:UDP-glucose 6-dehydrogenase TuaD [Candidatus Psychracetigena formicireducens]